MISKQLKLRAITSVFAGALVALAVVAGNPQSARSDESADKLSAAETEAFEKVVRKYLLENPEVIVEALQAYEQRQQAMEAERQRAAVVAEAANLNEDPTSPVLGNPEGDITVVEFFDYRCPYCKRVAGALQALVAEDPNVRLVMKEYPILSKESIDAARAALAAARQGRYERFHFALMNRGGSMSEAEVMSVAHSEGLDIDRLKRDMQSAEIEEALRRNHALAQTIGVTGTPAMVIGSTLVPGAVGLERLRALVAQARAEAS